VAERLEREAFFARARAQMERLREARPEEWRRSLEESHEWQAGTDRDAFPVPKVRLVGVAEIRAEEVFGSDALRPRFPRALLSG
jgi:hypothetical protein